LIDPLCDTVGNGSAEGVLGDALAEVSASMRAERIRAPHIPAVSALTVEAERKLTSRLRRVLDAVTVIVRAHAHDAEVREFLAVPAALRGWLPRQPTTRDLAVDLNRCDLIGATLGSVRVLEFNAGNIPGGAVHVGRISRFWRESAAFGSTIEGWNTASTEFEREHWLADRMLGLTPEPVESALILAPAGRIIPEAENITAQLNARDCPTVRCDPVDLPRRAKGVQIGFLKCDIDQLVTLGRSWSTLRERLREGSLVLVNPVYSRLTAGSKLCLAAMSDPRFARLFTHEQRQAIDRLIPWSRKLGDGIDLAEAADRRAGLVLKAPYGSRGRQVWVGRALDDATWQGLIADPGHRGWLVQEYVESERVRVGGDLLHRDLCPAMFNGSLVGYATRYSANPLLNVARGGQIGVVFSRLRATTADGAAM
jgi:hypothetical protein